MGAVAILRSLWQRRLLVAVGVAFAIAVGIMLTYRVGVGVPPSLESRQYDVGIASAEVLVDSPNSQVIDLGGSAARADIASLSVRARLLADLLATNPLKHRIARRAGVTPQLLVALPPSTEMVVEAGPLESASTDRTSDPRAHVLSLRVHEELPIIGIDSQAPDEQLAARIADAAVAELGLYLENAASATDVPSSRQIVVEPLGRAGSSTSGRGPGATLAVIAGFLAFVLWCAGILVVSGLVRGLRQPIAEPPADAPAAPEPSHPAWSDPVVPAVADPSPREMGPERPVEGSRPRQEPPHAPDLPERPAPRPHDMVSSAAALLVGAHGGEAGRRQHSRGR